MIIYFNFQCTRMKMDNISTSSGLSSASHKRSIRTPGYVEKSGKWVSEKRVVTKTGKSYLSVHYGKMLCPPWLAPLQRLLKLASEYMIDTNNIGMQWPVDTPFYLPDFIGFRFFGWSHKYCTLQIFTLQENCFNVNRADWPLSWCKK